MFNLLGLKVVAFELGKVTAQLEAHPDSKRLLEKQRGLEQQYSQRLEALGEISLATAQALEQAHQNGFESAQKGRGRAKGNGSNGSGNGHGRPGH